MSRIKITDIFPAVAVEKENQMGMWDLGWARLPGSAAVVLLVRDKLRVVGISDFLSIGLAL